MNLIRLYNKIFTIMQWNIGFCTGSIEQVIREKQLNFPVKWMPLKSRNHSIADPFIYRDKDKKLNLMYENFSDVDPSKYGTINLALLDENFNKICDKQILDTQKHSSYPFLFSENDKLYVIPETSSLNKVSIFEYDAITKTLTNEKVILDNLALLDSTIFKHENKYWLFATLAGNGNDHQRLHIYYSDSLMGNYTAHAKNPVKININGSRPAGKMIIVDGEIFRPAQNCGKYYGESISINKINTLTETEFSEELYFKIHPDKSSLFNAGVHTINVVDDIIVIDGIKMLFKPFTKWKLFYIKKFKNKI